MAVASRAERREKLPPQWAGLKFFNVSGPNEYHQGSMMGVLARRFDDMRSGNAVQLFKSYREGIADGDQRPLWNKGDFFGTLYNGPGAK